MNWQEKLEQFKRDNPELPDGPDTIDEPQPSPALSQPRVDIIMERKGRAGKTATIITGWVLDDAQLQNIASALQKKLGTGGSARGGDILIQGDRRADVHKLLTEMGYKSRVI
ncbi:MAG: translation initiation factor [Paramuribaculum sp.]|nr:translation initiation factor [Paramuribaculum sp.]